MAEFLSIDIQILSDITVVLIAL